MIRQAVPADAATLRELASRTFKETFAEENTAANMHTYLATAFSAEKIDADLVDPLRTALILEAGNVLAGYAWLRRGSAPGVVVAETPIELMRLYVDAAHHGTGLGALLMQASLATASALACDTVWLGVWERNLRAQEFYRKWGFGRVGEQLFQLGDDPQLDWLMARPVHRDEREDRPR